MTNSKPTPFIVHQPASGAAHPGSMEDCAVCAAVARERLRVFDAGELNELRNAVREALLTIQLWREGSYQRGKTDADTVLAVEAILEAVDV